MAELTQFHHVRPAVKRGVLFCRSHICVFAVEKRKDGIQARYVLERRMKANGFKDRGVALCKAIPKYLIFDHKRSMINLTKASFSR